MLRAGHLLGTSNGLGESVRTVCQTLKALDVWALKGDFSLASSHGFVPALGFWSLEKCLGIVAHRVA